MKKKQKLKERICALVLALAMVLTWVLPDAGMTVQAAAGDAKKVTLKFKDAAEETRGIGALTLKLQSNDDPSYEKKKEIEVKAGETSKEIELKEGVEYNYEVEKTGYETTKDGRFTVEAEKADIDILLTMSEITLLPTTDSVSLKVGETYDISVTNPVQELAYTWSTTDGNVASVENGKVTAKGEGSADISVTNGVKTKTVSVNVSKNQINGFSMTVKEPSGDDQSSVILTAKGLPADVSGNVIFYDVTGGQKTLLYKAEAAATVEYTYETDSLLGAKQFEAVYSGNEKYEGATATATGSYGKTQAITIDGDVSKEVTYGTEHWNDEIVIALADIENTLKGRTLATEVAFAQSEDAPNTGLAENVANVRVEESNHTIHVIPQNAGKITIKIKAVPGEGNFYREASVDYTLTVKRQEVSFENVTWNKASKVYDGNVSDESDESQNILEQLKPEEGIQDKVVENVKVYLKNSEDKSGNTVTEVTNLTDWLHIDNEAPRAVIKDYDTTKYSDAFESLSFNMFKNEIYTAEISVSDTSGDSVEGSGLHNTTTQKYCVYEMGTDETALKLDKDAVKSIIEKVDSGQEQSWSKLEFDKNGKDEITVGKAKDKEAAENNYLILVKTIDNTGNEAVYASNGIVVDVTSPKVECTFDTSKDGGYVSEKDGILCYQGDAKYELKIEDPEEYFSSISKLEVIVSKDGETITPTTKEFDADETYEDSYIIEWPTSESGFSYEELKNKSSIVVKGVVSANKGTINGVGTNKSKIKIKAYDTAGNVSETIEQQLAFDTKAPEISVSFENKNGDPITQKDEFSYYQDTTVMVIKYTDRNFPVGEEYKDNLYFILKREEDDQERKVMLEGLEKEGITYEIEDEEGKNSFENYTDNRVVTVKLTFDDQDKYEIKPYCVDMFGNEGKTKETYKFAVDTEAPVIEYTYEYLDADKKWKPLNDENAVKLKNAPIRVNVTVTDHFFSLKDNFVFEEKDGKKENTQVNTTLTAKEAVGKIPNYQEQADTWTAASSDDHPVGWTHNGDEHRIGFVFENDANYTFKLDYTDLSGRSKNTGDLKFTVDKTSPSGKILVDGTENWYAEFWNTITFNIFKDDNYNVKVTGADITSGVKTIEYYTTKDAIESADKVKKITEWKQLADSGVWNRDSVVSSINNRSFTMTEEQQFLTYAKITDYAGNVTYLYPKEIAVLDRTWAEPKITITAAEPLYGIYNKDVPFSINVEDPESGETYSGLKEVYYEVRKDGAVTQSGNYNKELEIDYSKNNQESAQKAGLTILDGRVQSLVKNETVTASLNNSNDVEIYVKVVDNAGHETEATKDLKIDITHPTIAVTYDLNTPLNERYYKDVRTATVVVTERNFDESAVRFNITNTDGTQPAISGWTHSANAGVSDDATHTCQVTFAADGDYTFTLETTDLAGNASSYNRVDDFTIDRTVPTIQVSYDNNSAATPGYFNANRTVTVTVNEHNFNAAEVNAQITAALQGSGVAAPGLGGWSTNGDVHTASVTFSADLVVTEVNVDSLVFNGISYGLDGTKKELKAGSDYTVKQSGGEGSWKEYTYTIKKENFEKEGRYSVTIDSEDKATNKMNNKVKECNIDFVIDKTPPTVVITGIEESSYRADEREMTINLSDNTAVKSVDVIIDGKSVATYAQKEIEKAGGKISYMIEGASEPQKIEAAALDMAGNETTSEMHKVLVTSSVWIQYINNTPLLIGSILGIVLVAGGLIWFFVIRKKKEESK